MNLEKYIRDLLYRHDLIIVPQFGAFVGSRKPAFINKKTGLFSPPSKDIAFNPSLTSNDGLLIQYIALKENIAFHQAEKIVLEKVATWKNQLNRTNRLRLEHIGFFNKINDKLIFTPFTSRNYLAESYGLHSFVRKPLSGKEEEKNLTFQHTPLLHSGRKEKSISIPSPVSGTRAGSKWIKYAAAVVIGLALLAGGYQTFQSKGVNQPVINQAGYPIPELLPEIVIEKNMTSLPDIHTIPKTTPQKHTYYIIIGAFQSYSNANKLVKRLKKQGIKATIPGKNPKGLYYVAYQEFENPVSAENNLIFVKKHFPGAWILKK